MKIKRHAGFHRGALVALGVFLGHGAQADTVLDFAAIPAGQQDNCNGNCPGILQGFGGLAAASSAGVTVTGFGTPNINLQWVAIGAADTHWDYYQGWLTDPGAAQLNDSDIGDVHDLTFVPNSPSASVVVGSFNFFPYYQSTERFTYNVSVLAGTNVVNGPAAYSFVSDATNDHHVVIAYTGAPGQALKLRIARVASTLSPGEVEGGAYNIAVDTIEFAQTPATAFPAGPQVVLDTPPDDQTNEVAVYDPPVMPADDQTGLPATSYPFLASITNGATTLVASSIQLKLDGNPVSPPPSISSAGGLTSVGYPGTNLLTRSGVHSYTLTYTDNLGASYTYEADFSSIFATLPSAWALPEGSGVARGFTYLTVVAPQDATNSVLNTITDAIGLLNGTLVDPSTGLPYTNVAIRGPNPDGSYNESATINFDGDGTDEGDFPNDQIFPGLDPGALPYDWFATKATLYLDLAAGYYRLGVNSDDGFQVNALPPQGVSGAPILLGEFAGGRGAADTLFDVLAPTTGIYPFQVLYFQAQQKSTEEFFSSTNFATAGGILINDPSNTNAIVSYRELAPFFTSIVQSGPNVTVDWAYGAPPFQVVLATNLSNPVWKNVGSPTSNTTANIPIQPGAGFIRVFGQ